MSLDSFAREFIVWVALGEFRELERNAHDRLAVEANLTEGLAREREGVGMRG